MTQTRPQMTIGWNLLIPMALFFVFLALPMTREVVYNATLSAAWKANSPPVILITYMNMWLILSFMLGMCLAIFGSKRLGGKTNRLRPAVLAFALVSVGVVPQLQGNLTVGNAVEAIMNVKQAQARMNATPVIAPQVREWSENYQAAKTHAEDLREVRFASTKPEAMMQILPGIDLLGADHPASAFVLNNGMVRDVDKTAVAQALREYPRGDIRVQMALAQLNQTATRTR